MKKLLLSMAALMVTSAAFAQPFTNGDTEFTESFGTSGTSCLKNFTNAGYAFADGNIASATNNANEITITAVPTASLAPGLAPGIFDFYFTNAADQCAAMRPSNVGVDVTPANGGNPTIIVRAKSSVAGATVQFHIGSYPTATTASVGVPTAITEKTLTTSFVDYAIDFTSSQWTATTAAVKEKVNVWGVLIPHDNTLNGGAVITIEYVTVGAIVTANNNANVVNDQVTLAPNPASTSFNVDMTAMNNSEAASVKVLNSNGVIVKEFTTSANSEVVTTEGLNKGIYMVQVTAGNKIATKKVVVE